MATTISELCKNLIANGKMPPGYILSDKDAKIAGKILKKSGDDATCSFILDHAKLKDQVPNFSGGPVRCNIIACSRPFSEWPISMASIAIQQVVYNLPDSELPKATSLTRKDEQVKWLSEKGLSKLAYKDVQGLNKIFNNAISTYEGVKVKVDNKNKKMRERFEHDAKNGKEQSYDEIKAFDNEGRLLQKPTPNHSIFCYQQVSPKAFICSKYPNINLPEPYVGYYRDPDKAIISPYPANRLEIKKDQVGYIPTWQHSLLSKNNKKRMRLPRRLRQQDAILGIITIGDDWVVFDMRGLLRANHWREKYNREQSINDTLAYFSGDPVIDPKNNVVSFLYKKEHGIRNFTPISEKKGKEFLSSLVDRGECDLATIDVGQNNPVSVGVYKIEKDINGSLTKENIARYSTPDNFIDKIAAYRKRTDDMELKFKSDAITELSPEFQDEIKSYYDKMNASLIRDEVCVKLNINSYDLPWAKMSSGTTYISDQARKLNVSESEISFVSIDKDGKTKSVVRSDYNWFQDHKPKLSKECRDALSSKEWELRRTSPAFQKLSKNKEQTARELANWIASKCDVIAIEKLVKKNNFFGGYGKREAGWDNFLKPKRENRWWINALHKALQELGVHKGKPVLMLSAMRTSITCPRCSYCDKDNRNEDNRELFKCLKCGVELNADKEVAVDNLATVAITGTSMPKPACERLNGEKKPGGARKGKGAKLQTKLTETTSENIKEVA